ncbi:MAG: hypothetical protein E7505_00235 [Ruminococcus sp.]|nr:hypothetical protein [Ruminococcus sp.]
MGTVFKKSYTKAFVISFFLMMMIMLPAMITDGGYFIYMGDYNFQHIIFNAHCFDIFRSGFSGWDFVTGLGGDTFLSYSHIITTPFFWFLFLVRSVNAAVLILPVITALKTAVAALTSYIYIRRYTRTDDSAVIGSLLYAFSGFQTFSFVFGSFHDITAWFPLMLLSMDMYMKENKKAFFALTVAYMAALNAFFFYGQAVFLIIYFVIKCVSREYDFSFKKLSGLGVEAVIGVLLSGILLYPSVVSLMSNSRVSEFISGFDMISYPDATIPWRIVQSIFMMPDKAGVFSLFEGENGWTSISLYLPFVGIVFVLAHIRQNKRSSFSLLTVISLFVSLIPVLNSFFFMFNKEFYARWFYMPLLIMAAMTSLEIDNDNEKSIAFGIRLSLAGLGLLGLLACLPGTVDSSLDEEFQVIEKTAWFGFACDPLYFWKMAGLAALAVMILYLVYFRYKNKKKQRLLYLVMGGIFLFNTIYVSDMRNIDAATTDSYPVSVLKKPDILNNEEEYFRIDGQIVNANILWNVPALDNFITMAPSSVYDFYDEFEISRTQKAYIDSRYYPLYALLSVKYYMSLSTNDELNVELVRNKMEGFYEVGEEPCYHIYENKGYIPIGFMYDYCIGSSSLDEFTEKYGEEHPEEKKEADNKEDVFDRFGIGKTPEYNYQEKYLQKMLVMMRALVLSDEDAERYGDILPAISEDDIIGLDSETYYSDSEKRRNSACEEFKTDRNSFYASVDSERENLVFFSIPYEEGWSAEVNGRDAEIIRANYGFMAVKVESGKNDIVFTYSNKKLYNRGMVISLIGAAMLVVYMMTNHVLKRKSKKV